nr:hypothetical protein [uncultured bacterium]AUG44428.1 hypothetical protein [uncultured bacterium]
MVELHLAKVVVAGSIPVSRSSSNDFLKGNVRCFFLSPQNVGLPQNPWKFHVLDASCLFVQENKLHPQCCRLSPNFTFMV